MILSPQSIAWWIEHHGLFNLICYVISPVVANLPMSKVLLSQSPIKEMPHRLSIGHSSAKMFSDELPSLPMNIACQVGTKQAIPLMSQYLFLFHLSITFKTYIEGRTFLITQGIHNLKVYNHLGCDGQLSQYPGIQSLRNI